MKCDRAGRLWSTGPGNAVWVIEPDGTVVGLVKFAEQPANLAWGGPNWSTLFVTARGSVYRVQTNATGARVPS